ncbi:phosphatase PAP2 family protein [uncultured Sphingomonas sp.]|uniref:phosphatase PAP2 family protein n=1 Tax=uncultured Sphingomonas sp. TaxID=158754 RepID=UPI002605445F|nr:phosphatase PAP2 family protein [uncultured Sphingomonas sp.]
MATIWSVPRIRRLARARPDIVLSATVAFTVLAALLVTWLGSEILEGETHAFDRAALLWIRHNLGAVPGLRPLMLDLTALGDTTTLILVVLAVMGYLFASGRAAQAIRLAVMIALGTSLSFIIKPLFGRTRPDVVAHWAPFSDASFPSGHAANSAIVYLSLAAFAAAHVSRAGSRFYLMALAFMIAVLIGLSRLYLGVHWPTDVFAGWLIGAAWALVVAFTDRRIRVTIRRARRKRRTGS